MGLVDAVDDGWGPHGSVVPMAAIEGEKVSGAVVWTN